MHQYHREKGCQSSQDAIKRINRALPNDLDLCVTLSRESLRTAGQGESAGRREREDRQSLICEGG